MHHPLCTSLSLFPWLLLRVEGSGIELGFQSGISLITQTHEAMFIFRQRPFLVTPSLSPTLLDFLIYLFFHFFLFMIIFLLLVFSLCLYVRLCVRVRVTSRVQDCENMSRSFLPAHCGSSSLQLQSVVRTRQSDQINEQTGKEKDLRHDGGEKYNWSLWLVHRSDPNVSAGMIVHCAPAEMSSGGAWFALLQTWTWWWNILGNIEMEKEKRKFNLSRVLFLYLFKKDKSLTSSPTRCPNYRLTSIAGTATDNSPDTSPALTTCWTVMWHLLVS